MWTCMKPYFFSTSSQGYFRPHPDVIFRVMNSNDIEPCARFVAERFCQDEVISKALKIKPEMLEAYKTLPIAKIGVKYGISVVANEKSSNAIAGCLLVVPENELVPLGNKMRKKGNIPVEMKIFTDLSKKSMDGIYFDKAVELFMGATSKAFSNKKILSNMFQAVHFICKDKGFCTAYVECTNPQSRKAAERCGYVTRRVIDYSSYTYKGKRRLKHCSGEFSLHSLNII